MAKRARKMAGDGGNSRGTALVPVERVARTILLIRGEKVILDADLAVLYGVTTKRLNEQVKRNRARFPPDFMFQLTMRRNWRWSQVATTSRDSGSRQCGPTPSPSTAPSWPQMSSKVPGRFR